MNGDVYKKLSGTWTFQGNIGGPAGLPGGNFVKIAEQVLGADAASVTFSSIPQNFTHLKLVCYGRITQAIQGNNILLRFNGDTGANYDYQILAAFAASAGNSESFAQTGIVVGDFTAANASTSTQAALSESLIPVYAGTTFDKNIVSHNGVKYGTSTTNMQAEVCVGFWRSTAAINSITLYVGSGNIKAGSVFSLYGIGGSVPSSSLSPSTNDFRLTLASGNPVYSPQPATPSSTDTTADTCTFASAHGWTSGTIATPSVTGGGLTNGTLYYLRAVSSTVVSFHTTVADALAGTNKVDLTASITAEIRPSGVSNTTLYLSPYNGNTICLYSGGWQGTPSAEVSLAPGTLTNNTNYDVFGYLNAGAVAMELGPAWTSDTARATALVQQDGVWVKSGDATRRYLGTIRMNSTTTMIDDAGGLGSQVGGKRFLWNASNRISAKAIVRDATANWSYNSHTVRQANGATGNKVEFIVGLAEDDIVAVLVGAGQATNDSGSIGIGIDSITAFRFDSFYSQISTTSGNLLPAVSRWDGRLVPGYHYCSWLEQGVNATFDGENGASSKCGLVTVVMN